MYNCRCQRSIGNGKGCARNWEKGYHFSHGDLTDQHFSLELITITEYKSVPINEYARTRATGPPKESPFPES